jgi:hypothetical protein
MAMVESSPTCKAPDPAPEKVWEEREPVKVLTMFAPAPAPEPWKEPEPASAPGTFVVKVQKTSGDDKVGLQIGRKKHTIVVKAVSSGLIQSYNQTASKGKIVMTGTQIIEVRRPFWGAYFSTPKNIFN